MEGPADVGDQTANGDLPPAQMFPHVYGPLRPLQCVVAEHKLVRAADGTFLRVEIVQQQQLKEKASLPFGWGERTATTQLEQLSKWSKGGAAANVEFEGLLHESTAPVKNISGENTAVSYTSDLTPSGIPLGWSERSHAKTGGFGSHSWDDMSSDAAAASVYKGGLQQTTMFIASSVWAGSKEGMVFKEGAQGLGYYSDSVEHIDNSDSPNTDSPNTDSGSILEAIKVAGHEVPTVGSEEERILLDMEDVASRGGKTFQVYLE